MADDWMDKLASERAERQAQQAQEEDHERRRQQEIKTALEGQLPDLKSRLGKAAESLTTRFKERMGFGSELTCFNDPNVFGPIRVRWSKNASSADLIISASQHLLSFKMTTEPSFSNLPSVGLRIVDGQLLIQVNGKTMDPESAAEEILRPFFTYIAKSG